VTECSSSRPELGLTINTKTLLCSQVLRKNAASRLPMERDQRDFL
jgi:hypothetical protein